MRATTTAPHLSIVIVAYKSRAYIAACLDSLARHAPKAAHEIFLVDNASGDGTVELVRKNYPHVTVIANATNEGFARANNRAIEQARGKFILLLNPDAEVTAGALDTLVKIAESVPRLGALAPKLTYPDGSYQPNFYRFPSIHGQLSKLLFLEKRIERRAQRARLTAVDCVWGAALLFPRQIDGRTTYLDKNIFLYSEDLELCWALARKGRTNYVTGAATFVHAHNKSGEQLYGGDRANLARLSAFVQTLSYVTRRYWRGPLKETRFWVFRQLEAFNASLRGILLKTVARRRYAPAELNRRIAEHIATAKVFAGSRLYSPVSKLEGVIIAGALALFAFLALTIAVQLPRGRGNDEDSHVTYIRYVADYRRLPDPLAIDFGVNREPHQPPLYYTAGATWLTLVRPLGLGVDSLRIFTFGLGLLQFWILWLLSRDLLPRGWRVLPLVFFASIPMLAHGFAVVNNDSLSYLMVSLLTLALVRVWQRPDRTPWYLVAALAGNAAVMSKLFAVPAVVVFGAAITLAARRAQRIRMWLAAVLVGALPFALWVWHGYATTGLVLPELHLGSMPILSAYLETPDLGYWYWFVIILWQTLVGRYGSWDIVFPTYLYILYLVPILVGMLGAILQSRRAVKTKESVPMQRLVRWTAGAFILELLMLGALNLRFFQPQARYLYPLLGGLLLAWSWGLRRVVSWQIAVLAVGALGVTVAVLTPGLLAAY